MASTCKTCSFYTHTDNGYRCTNPEYVKCSVVIKQREIRAKKQGIRLPYYKFCRACSYFRRNCTYKDGFCLLRGRPELSGTTLLQLWNDGVGCPEEKWPIFSPKIETSVKRIEANEVSKQRAAIMATDLSAPASIMNLCQKTIKECIDFPLYISYIGNRKRSIKTMYEQLLECLGQTEAEFIYVTEHDVLYTKEHFSFIPIKNDVLYYPKWTWRISERGLYKSQSKLLSGLVCSKRLLRQLITTRLEEIDKGKKFKHSELTGTIERFPVQYGNIDVRHEACYTGGTGNEQQREKKATFKTTIPYWGTVDDLLKELYGT